MGGICLVLGASAASSMAAYILAKSFDKVIILEQAEELGIYRKSLQQGPHFHNFLGKGQEILESIIPGISSDFASHGCTIASYPKDLHWLTSLGLFKSEDTCAWQSYLMDRTLLEKILIKRLEDHSNIEIILGARIHEILFDKKSFKGFRYRKDGQTADIEGDFAVIGGGRQFDLAGQLIKNGFAVPKETFIPTDFTYLSQIRKPNKDLPKWKVRFEQGIPPYSYRGAIMAKLNESNDYMFMIGGWQGVYPKINQQEDFLKELSDPVFLEFYKNSNEVSKPHAYRIDGSRYRPYGKMGKEWPKGMIAIGDCVCAFNPVYGQGLSVAALEVYELSRMIPHTFDFFADTYQFQKRIDKIIDLPLNFATLEDKCANGTQSRLESFASRYAKAYMHAATMDKVLATRFFKINHMFLSTLSFFSPSSLVRVIKFKFFQIFRTR